MNRLAILGCGTMGEVVLAGLADAANAPDVSVVTVRRASVGERLTSTYGVPALTTTEEAMAHADVALLAVKPSNAREVLDAPGAAEALQGKLLISLCAGITTAQLTAWAPGAAIVRAMPNTPCSIRQGMTVLSPGPHATDSHLGFARSVFEAVGRVLVMPEKHLDAVTGLSGSGPAFACVILEALADGGVRMGLPRAVAVELAAQTFQGTARMVLETGRHPAALKDDVTTPAGCTIAGLLTMEDGKIRSVLARTIEEATMLAASLGSSE